MEELHAHTYIHIKCIHHRHEIVPRVGNVHFFAAFVLLIGSDHHPARHRNTLHRPVGCKRKRTRKDEGRNEEEKIAINETPFVAQEMRAW